MCPIATTTPTPLLLNTIRETKHTRWLDLEGTSQASKIALITDNQRLMSL